MNAAESYAARIDAITEQRTRLVGEDDPGDRWSAAARRFRMDPRRELDANLHTVASYVEPDDAVVDVGGGAGRVCLPLALHCRAVINLDPSPAMGVEFEASAAGAGIANARFICSGWPAAETVEGDVVLSANVTYFVRDIVPFVHALEASARRRVIITVWSIPPPSQNAELFQIVYGEAETIAPSYRELLPVLWDLDILPEVRVLPNPFHDGTQQPATREEAVTAALQRLRAGEDQRARKAVEDRFDELFSSGPDGFRALWRPDVRELLITWEPRRRR